MLNSITLKNFGPLEELTWSGLGTINLVIGRNGSGKTLLLKALYSAIRTLEEYKRGDDMRSAADILVEKLYWTFQPDKVGDLVTKGADSGLRCQLTVGGRDFSYQFGKDTARQIAMIENHVEPRSSNSVFLPAKEVLSLHQVILKSREQDKVFGFDDTYFDLAKALQIPAVRGKNFEAFAQSRTKLEQMFGGTVVYDQTTKQWQFQQGRQKFPIGVTAEGIRKIAILDTLLGNRYLSPDSVVFVDEPESALHPEAIAQLLDIVELLAKKGIQFFLASHSYFVIKKLYLMAQEQGLSIPVLSLDADGYATANLKDGMVSNPIVDESIRLYEQEVELALGK